MLSTALKRTTNSIRIRNSCVSWARAYSATTATSSPLDQFRDAVSREKRTIEEVGRSWSVTELRRKNFDDIHKLWIVLYKEKNMLLTETNICRQNGVYFPQKERQQKVKKSMGAIKVVLGERKRDKIAQSALKALEKADADNQKEMMELEKADADADADADANGVSQSPAASNDQKEGEGEAQAQAQAQAQGEDEAAAASEAEKVKKPNTNESVTTTKTTTNAATSKPTMPGGLKETKDPQPLEERRIQFLELRSYEAKRRTIYTSKMKSTNLYWRAFRNMLAQAYEETDRAENLVRGTLAANESYANFLTAAAEDRLDYAGKPVDKKRGERIKAERGHKYSSLGGGGLLSAVAAEQDRMKLDAHKSDEFENDVRDHAHANANANANHNVSVDGLPEHSMLHSLIQSQIEMANVMTENVNFVKEISLEKMHALRKELEAEVSVMGALGDATMFELKKAEDDVQKSWAAYYSLAALVDTDIDSPRIQKAAGKGMNANTITDVWLLEMHYRMAVAYLTTVWDKSSSELSNLFAGMKEMECNRRFRLRELLVSFMERAEKMWTGIPPLLKPVIEDLAQEPAEIKVIEKDVSEKIRNKALELQKMDDAVLSTDHPLNGPGLAGVPEPDESFELQSPLMSDLLCKVEVIWRKSDKLMSVWKPCLAATTSDCYLHLFEIPALGNVQVGTAPEVAFQALVPPVEVPTEDSIIDGLVSNGRSWFEHLVPGASFDLKNSNISFNQQKGNSTFEITETLAPNSFSKIAKNVRKRKFSLRLYSSQHMVEWLLALRALGAD